MSLSGWPHPVWMTSPPQQQNPSSTALTPNPVLSAPPPSAQPPSAQSPSQLKNYFLSLPPEILEQIALETYAADCISLWLTHPILYNLFRPENNFFWFKTTLRQYALHYGPPPKLSSTSSDPTEPYVSIPPEVMASPLWQALWQLNILRSLNESRAIKNKEHLFKYDHKYEYFTRIKIFIQGNRGCQVCCIGIPSESKFYASFNRRLCNYCFDDMTISMFFISSLSYLSHTLTRR